MDVLVQSFKVRDQPIEILQDGLRGIAVVVFIATSSATLMDIRPASPEAIAKRLLPPASTKHKALFSFVPT